MSCAGVQSDQAAHGALLQAHAATFQRGLSPGDSCVLRLMPARLRWALGSAGVYTDAEPASSGLFINSN